ncbi:MAG: hypothetical protein QW680_13680 [Pyrobaculum sp.]
MFDVTFLNRLRRYDVVVYLGNFAPLCSVSKSFRKVLFLNGIVPYELRGFVLKNYSLKRRVRVSIGYIWWSVVNMRLVKPDAYICRSVTACELDRLPREMRVILPQFVLPEEELYDRYAPGEVRENVLLTYMSFAFSDRLLPLTVFFEVC